MVFTPDTILIILALVCFALAAVSYPTGRLALTPLGLFFWCLTVLV